IAMTLVLCAVFVPAAFSGGFEGQFYQQFALTIAFAALISAVNSLTLSPALSALLLRPHDAAPDRVQRGIDAAFGWLFRPFNRFFTASASGYQRGVRKVLRAGGIGLAVYAGLLGLTALGFVQAPKGFVPTQDKGYLITIVQLPPSASIERTEAVVRRIGEIALEQPGVANAVQFPGLSINGFTRTTNSAIVFTPLTPFDERGTALSGDAIAQALGAKFAEIDDAFVLTIAPPPVRGFGPAGGFKLQIEDRTDQGADALFRATQELAAKARQTPGLVGVFTNYEINAPQLYADVDRVKAKQLGIDLNELFTTLQAYLGSYYVNDFNRFGRTFRVLVQADEPFRDRADDVLLLQTRNAAGQMVPLGSVLSLRDSYGPTTVQRYNGFPSADLNGMPAPGYSSGEAIAIIDRLAAETLPPGMTYDWTEITYQQVVASGALGIVLVLGVLFVFLVLAAQYESLSLPLAIILIVPMSLLSALAGIYLTGSDINIFTQIGLFVLMGLAAKNAILIVEFARELQHQGMSYVEAALEACRLRLRPILMTSFAFILGVLPLAIATGAGAEIQRAMGIAVFFGMLGVTFFGLFLTPLFYVVIRRLVEGRGAAATPAADAASPAPALPGH
ncbi:MAG: efflux RND transporter permease subunit, partial [Pseudomonadota bacterium]|nr:efflux RND transporter permease subunit [Pseudomonadota bacterium]